jgi:hypothetical protein
MAAIVVAIALLTGLRWVWLFCHGHMLDIRHAVFITQALHFKLVKHVTTNSVTADQASRSNRRGDLGIQTKDQDPDRAAISRHRCDVVPGALASGQINMRKMDGWQTLATKPIDQPIDLAA